MASKRFIGTASTRQQVDTLTVGGTVEIGDKFKITMTDENGVGVTLSVSATTTSLTTTATEIATAFNASYDSRFTPVTAAATSGGALTLTADQAGVPFYCTVTTTESDNSAADTQTFTQSTTTSNKGPSDANCAENYSDGVVPTTGDTLQFDATMAADLLYGLNQSGVTLDELRIYQRNKAIGSTSAPYKIGATLSRVNLPPDDGASTVTSGFVRLDGHTAASTVNIYGSGNAQSGILGVTWKGVNASNVVNVYGGTVGIATAAPGDAATVLTVNSIGNGGNVNTQPKVVISSGVTITNVNVEANAKAIVRSATTSINVTDKLSELTTELAVAHATIHCGGKGWINSTGTITNLYSEGEGAVTTRQTNATRTITNAFVDGREATLTSDLNTTFTNGVDCVGGATSNQIDMGTGVTASFTAV